MASGIRCLIVSVNRALTKRILLNILRETDWKVDIAIEHQGGNVLQYRRPEIIGSTNRSYDEKSRVGYYLYGDRVQNPFNRLERKYHHIIYGAAHRGLRDLQNGYKVEPWMSRSLFEFSGQCRNLESLSLLSSIYATGLKAGATYERFEDVKPNFANSYEQAMWEAEYLLNHSYHHLPWRVFRISSLISDDEKGYVSRINFFHQIVKVFFFGLLKNLPGREQSPIYLTTNNWVSERILRALMVGDSQKIYHLCHPKSESLTLGQIIEIAYEEFGYDQDFLLRKTSIPRLVTSQIFRSITWNSESLPQLIIKRSKETLNPFVDQLFTNKKFSIENNRNLGEFNAPPIEPLVRNMLRFLIKSKWSRCLV